MAQKPTYEELERKVKESEKEAFERKRLEKALRESEEQYRSLLDDVIDSSDVGLFILDADFKIVWVNKALERYFGLRKEEVVGKDKRQLILAQIKYKFADPEDFAGKVLATYDNNTYTENFECHVLPNGERKERHLEHWSRPIQSGLYAGGRVELYYDVTERKHAEKALRESQERYRNLIENAVIGIYQVAKEGKFLMINQRMADMFGYTSPQEFLTSADNVKKLYAHPKERPMILQEINDKGFVEGKEVEFKRKDGKSIWIKLNTRVTGDKDNGIIYEGLMEDITERKALEAHLQQALKMEAIGTLAGGIAHDFNNILGIILGNTELAMFDVPQWNSAQNNLEEVRKACLRAKGLVQQILTFSRQTEHRMIPVNINPIIKESFKMLRASIPTTIEIRRNISEKWATVKADSVQINQVLLNLCSNAAHAMKEKGGILEIGLENVAIDEDMVIDYHDLMPGNHVKLTVSDTGCGIEPEVLERIFDPYFTTKEVGEGSGMGLAVAQGIVKSHGGTISVSSELGKGTTFNVYLPVIEDAPEEEIAVTEAPPRGNERILFVDDEEAIVDIGKQMLGRLGYEVVVERNPVKALEIFKENPGKFDLVITDMTMPKMTGVMLSEELINIRSDSLIILCTGHSDQINEEKAKEMGIRALVMKPIVIGELAKTVRKILDEK